MSPSSTAGEARIDGHGPEPIAIIGMDCIFPKARDLVSFWWNIVRGVDAIRKLAGPRYNPRAYGLREVWGGSIEGLTEFDPVELGIPPAEVEAGDPEQFLVLGVVHRALRDAQRGREALAGRHQGCRRSGANGQARSVGGSRTPTYVVDPERVEVVVGRGGYLGNGSEHIYLSTDFVDQVADILASLAPRSSGATSEDFRRRLLEAVPRVDSDVVACAIPNLIAGRVANRLNLMGTSHTVDAACASSLIAVDTVVRDLRDRRCDLGIACGVHITHRASFWFAFQNLQVLSLSGRISPYSADADGLVVGEGVGAVVLKRLSDALRDGDRIYALIRSVGVASDGLGAGLLTPRAEGQALAIRRAYEACALDPRTVTLIEGHGTATKVGDATEITVLHQMFGREGFPAVALGSVKSMIGHAMPAAGMAGLIKTALAVYHRILPPTINVRQVHPELEGSRLCVNTTVRPWISPLDQPRRAGVNAFGFGGINAHAILEEGPEEALGLAFTPRNSELFVLSAPSRDELVARIDRWEKATEALDDQQLPDVCSTVCQVFRPFDAFRLAVVASTASDLAAKLSQVSGGLQRGESSCQDSAGVYFESSRYSGKVVVLFPGIGFPGLIGGYTTRLAELCLHFPEIRRTFDRVDGMSFGDEAPYPLSHLLFPPALLDAEVLSKIEKELSWSERSPFATGWAYFATWQLAEMVDLEPDAIAGFSLGEGTSLLAAGVLKPDEINASVGAHTTAWAEYRKRAADLEMRWAAVSASAEQVEGVLRQASGHVSMVMDVAPTQLFIAGEGNAVREVLRKLEAQGLWGQVLPVIPMLNPYLGVHTDLARAFEDEVRQYLQGLPVRPARYRVYSGTRAEPFPDDPEGLREMALASMNEPVRIRQTIERLYDDGHRVFVQLGSGGKMLTTIRNTLGQREHVALSIDMEHRGGLEQFHHMLGRLVSLGVPLRLENLFVGRLCQTMRLEAPSKPTAGSRVLPLTPPRLQLSEEARQWFRGQFQTVHGALAAERTVPPFKMPEAPPPACRGPLGEAIALMDRFLEVQREADEADAKILVEYLRTQEAAFHGFFAGNAMPLAAHGAQTITATLPSATLQVARSGGSPGEHDSQTGQGRFPLLGEVQSYVPGRELRARLVLDLSEHVFLGHHALLQVPDSLKPVEERLPTLPFTFEVEILAEAAEALVPGRTVVSCEDMRAATWISLVDGRRLDVEILATRTADDIVEVELRAGPGRITAFQGKALMAPDLPVAPVLSVERFGDECPLSAEEFYTRSSLFHGELFHAIKRFRGMKGDAVEADVVVSDPTRMFATPPGRSLVFDPILMDALGQIVAYRAWLDKWLVFPTHVRSIQRFALVPPPGTLVRCVMRYRKLNARQVEADIEAFDPGGKLLMRIEGWRDWRVIHPRAVVEARHRPRESFLARPWSAGDSASSCFRVAQKDLLDLQPDWVARLYLREAEAAVYNQRPNVAWLLGRVAAKDAVRDWLSCYRGIELHPLEVEIGNRPDGSPVVEKPDRCGLSLSLSHLADEAIALASKDERVGVDIVALAALDPSFEQLAFSEDERCCLPRNEHERLAWVHRAWAAKEAAAKAHRHGLADVTKFEIRGILRDTGVIEILSHADGMILRVPTHVEGGRAFAVFTCA